MNIYHTDFLQDIHNYGACLSSRDIYLHNSHNSDGENPGVEYRMASSFIKNITTLDKKSQEDITIHMHSIGGEWSDGMAIYDAVRLCRSRISMIVYGQAESMSSIILQSADERIMTANSYFMLHYGSSAIHGDYNSVHNWLKFEEYICDRMFNTYAKRAYKGAFFKEKYGGRKENIPKVEGWLKRKLRGADWYMTPTDAVHYGFADRII